MLRPVFTCNYQAQTEIEPTSAGGTSIHWHGVYSIRWGMGLLIGPYPQRFMPRRWRTGLLPMPRRSPSSEEPPGSR
jgi:hypothetical protein